MKIRYPSGEEIELQELRQRLVMYCQDSIIRGLFNGRIFPLLEHKQGHAFGTLVAIIEEIEEQLAEEEKKFLNALREADKVLFKLHQSDYQSLTSSEREAVKKETCRKIAPHLDTIIPEGYNPSCARYVQICEDAQFGTIENGVFRPFGLNIIDNSPNNDKT